MDTIDKWLKSLRLHKYTHLFERLSYHEMLNLDENYLIDNNVTKGARNKMLVSVKKLNLRQDRLINMIDDIDQENISMKEALTVLKEMLVTPIPSPFDSNSPPRSSRLSVSSETSSSISHLDPYELTYLYIETLDKLAARLIESAGLEDNACHGIMVAILDECIKHNSFTKEQKAKVASYKQHFFKEQRAKVASYKQHFIREQKVKVGSFEQQLRQRPHSYNHNHYLQHQNQQLQLQQQQHQHRNHNHHHQQQQQQQLLLPDQQQPPQQPLLQQQPYPSIHYNQPQPLQQQQLQQQQPLYHQYDHNYGDLVDYSSSGIKQQIYNQLPLKQQQENQTYYREYSLLRPAITFELPCLRALVEKNSQV